MHRTLPQRSTPKKNARCRWLVASRFGRASCCRGTRCGLLGANMVPSVVPSLSLAILPKSTADARRSAAAPPPLASPRHHRLVDCWICPGLPMRATDSDARVAVGVSSCGRARLLCILVLSLVLVVLACRRLLLSSHLIRLHHQNQHCQLRAWNRRRGAYWRPLCTWRRQGRSPKRREGQQNGISCAPIVVYGQWWQAVVERS